MNMSHISLLFAALFISINLQAEEFKKIYDKQKMRVVEICSTDADGSMNVAVRCKYDWIDIPFIAYKADPKIKRKPEELTEIITPVHTYKTKDSVYAVFRNALVEVQYSMSDKTSSVLILKPSDETPSKYSSLSGWIVPSEIIAYEVDQNKEFKKGDIYCLKNSPDGYPQGLPVQISKLFKNENFAVVDTVNKGFLGMGNTFEFHFTDLNNLIKCEEKNNLNPNKMIDTNSPIVGVDLKINDQTTPKETESIPLEKVENATTTK